MPAGAQSLQELHQPRRDRIAFLAGKRGDHVQNAHAGRYRFHAHHPSGIFAAMQPHRAKPVAS